ncbi:MAG TPA: hypothetical protein VMB21_02535 [Candidatus Limnocylindria bacterium]|nr:hypothetical protein [Candidatus Limnocylindria bacterium]
MRRRLPVLLSVILGFAAAQAAERSFDFSQTKPGEMPEGFRAFRAGIGKEGDWQIVLDDIPTEFKPRSTNAAAANRLPVLAQVARDAVDERFPILLYDGEVYGDLTLTTRFKIVGGTMEQMAGVVFRMQDEKNFYVVRANALDGNVRFYKFFNGDRSAPIGNSMPVTKGVWHELSVTCTGNRIQVRLDGKEAMPELTDNSFLLGKLGFMTKSDSLAYFSEAKVSYRPLESLASTLIRDTLAKQPRLKNLRIYGKTTAQPELHVIASKNEQEAGMKAEETELKVFSENQSYLGRTGKEQVVTVPLHDRNGETVGVVKFFLKPFLGQTEANVIARVLPVVREMELRVGAARDLNE